MERKIKKRYLKIAWFSKACRVVGFILLAIVLWPFLAPLLVIKGAYAKHLVFMNTETGRNKWFRLVMYPVRVVAYIPSLIFDLTVGYGVMAFMTYYIYVVEGKGDLTKCSKETNKMLRNFLLKKIYKMDKD